MALILHGHRSGTTCLNVVDRSQTGEARRMAAAWAEHHGCSAAQCARLALVVTELAGNLTLHTTEGGCLLLRLLSESGDDSIEILSLDRGPGTTNFGAFLQDGYSTAGTAGTGLGAVRRAADLFEVHSQPEIGTALLCHLYDKPPVAKKTLAHGMINVPKKGEQVCGDSSGHLSYADGRMRLMVADGLGHGPLAAEASQTAVNVFLTHPSLDIADLLEKMHGHLRATRGAAVAIAEVDPANEVVRYSGVGNIAGFIVRSEAESGHMVSMNGTLGMIRPRLQQFSYPWGQGALVVMSSDGLKNHWRLDRYSGLIHRHPSLLAGVLFRDHSRQTDDTTVAILGN